jgi:dihydrofolate reductase
LHALAGSQPGLPAKRSARDARPSNAYHWVKAIAALKAGDGKHILVAGDKALALALLRAGLIDETHLFINPSTLPKGTSISNRKPLVRQWQLVGVTICDGAFVYRRYLLLDRN